MSLMALLFIVCGERLMRFISPDPAVVQLGTTLFVYAAVFQFFDAIAITHSCALRGAGDTMWSSVVGAAEVWVILIGGGAVVARLRPDLGSAGPWALRGGVRHLHRDHPVRALAMGAVGEARCDRAARARARVHRNRADRVAADRVGRLGGMMNAALLGRALRLEGVKMNSEPRV